MNIESVAQLFLKIPSIFIVLVPRKTKRYAAEGEGQTYRFLFCGFVSVKETVTYRRARASDRIGSEKHGKRVKLSESRCDFEKTGVSKGGEAPFGTRFCVAKSSVLCLPADRCENVY